MKICLVSEYFYPQSTGGTEKYVLALAKKLIIEKNEVEILTASPNGLKNYEYDGIYVRIIQSNENLEEFDNILKSESYDCIHFHTLTPTFNTTHMALAKTFSNSIYFTAHIPSVTCIHGDLMQFGKIACDGLIITHRCTACYISKKNIAKIPSRLFAGIINQLNYPKSTAGAVEKKLLEINALDKLCDKIYIFTEWQKRIFIINGFTPDKLIQLTQMEIPPPSSKINQPIVHKKKGKLIIGFVGRLSYEKGLHILLSAFLDANRENLELHIAAIVEDKEDVYFQTLNKLTKGRANISWAFNLNQSAIIDFYQKVDLICIPSIGYETGPFVLYEALKYKLPVIANNLGDMGGWQEKGYQVNTYNNRHELTNMLNKLSIAYFE